MASIRGLLRLRRWSRRSIRVRGLGCGGKWMRAISARLLLRLPLLRLKYLLRGRQFGNERLWHGPTSSRTLLWCLRLRMLLRLKLWRWL